MGNKSEQVRDAIIAGAPDHKEMIMTRHQIATKWCEEHGADIDNLSIDQLLAIRALPEWINAGS